MAPVARVLVYIRHIWTEYTEKLWNEKYREKNRDTIRVRTRSQFVQKR